MPLESANFIADLVQGNPAAGDIKGEGDDHLRLIKKALRNSFPNLSGIMNRLVRKSTNYTVVAVDNYAMFSVSSGATLVLTAAATLANGFMIGIHADGNDFTIDPTGAELINGATALIIPAESWGYVFCDGTSFSLVLNVTDDSVYTGAIQDGAVTLAKLAPDAAPSDTTQINGEQLGYRNMPQVAESTGFTFELSDSGKHIYYTGGVATANIPAHASVAYPLGTAITLVHNGSGALTISAAAVTLHWAGTANSGNRVLAAKGIATLIKVATNTWFISGLGLT